MTKMYDVIYARSYENRDGHEKTDWMRCGRAFQTDKGFDILLYVVPVGSTHGEVRLQMRESDGKFQPRTQQQESPREPEVLTRRSGT